MKDKKSNCYHRKTIDLIEYRKNYPFGKKSYPRYSFKKIYAYRCEKCGEVIKAK